MHENILAAIRKDGFSFPALVQHFPELSQLKQVPQNPAYHAEGDVYCHTQMVCEALTRLPAWQEFCRNKPKDSLSSPSGSGFDEMALLFLSAAFHDIGKTVCTRLEDGNWVSPKHTITGAKLFRETAYREAGRFGLTFSEREFVASAIRYHGLPVWFWKKARPEMDLFRAAESLPLRLLQLLSCADVQGRKTENPNELSEYVEWFSEYAKELHVWEHPYPFANPYTKSRFFARDDVWQGASLYDSTEFDVIMLSGLPLAGKDSWIEKNGGTLPVVSLDAIRDELKIPPPKESGKVARVAMELAQGLLARKQPFIWNATNITYETRRKLVALFSGYGARVHILYLEAPYQELLARNRTRARHIPENVLEEMIKKLEIPMPWEAYEVTYLDSKN